MRGQVKVIGQKRKDERVWCGKTVHNDMKNGDGFQGTMDKRIAGNGWGDVSWAPPILVRDLIYFPTMVGMVYVLKWNVNTFDEDALVSVSDLGQERLRRCLDYPMRMERFLSEPWKKWSVLVSRWIVRVSKIRNLHIIIMEMDWVKTRHFSF